MTEAVSEFSSQPDGTPTPPIAPPVETPTPPTSVTIDPALVPDKYVRDGGVVDYNAMAIRLQQLEQKLGQPPTPAPAPGTTEPSPGVTPDDLTPFVHEFSNTGRLSEASFSLLEKQGLSREMALSLMQGQKAQMQTYYAAIEGAVGGREQYDSIAKWANANLSPEEAQYYQTQIHGGDQAAAVAAVKALQARSGAAAAGPAGGLLIGDRSVASGVVPFRSQEEMAAAKRVPSQTHPGKLRYETDPAYRTEVLQKHTAMIQAQAQAR